MIPELRQQFNSQFTQAKYAAYLARLEEVCGVPVAFRCSETPCFFPEPLLRKMAVAGREMAMQLLENPEYMRVSAATIPAEYNVPNEPDYPLFLSADFGIIRDPQGVLQPRLVEMQGFPSLYAMQPTIARAYVDVYGLDLGLGRFLSGLNPDSYREVLGKAILGQHDPENVVLLEIDPEHQKTRPDFEVTEKVFGVKSVCITKVSKRGNKLYHGNTPIKRIYNRCIVDELQRKNVKPAFDYRDDLDVEWAGHPNYYYRISKFSIPYLKHETVPKTWFLGGEIPDDLENYVLKPLYSFAGLGVIVGPSREDIDRIPAADRPHYILQQRMRFEPLIATPHGMTQAEVRIMYIWTGELTPVSTLIRMGRGKMMGVDHNKNLEWVGSSAGLSV